MPEQRDVTALLLRWTPEQVEERWSALSSDDREALMRFGHRPAPWERTPDTARRILVGDPKVTLDGVKAIDAIFRAAYNELTKEAA